MKENDKKIDITKLKSEINNKNKSIIKKKFYYFLYLIIILLSVIIIYLIIQNIYGKKQIKKSENIINNIVQIVEIVEGEEINAPEDKEDLYWKFINYSMIDIDLDELKNTNDETVGWIQVNNTNINYPIVKHNDNEFYLNHQFDKSYNTSGWVFMDYRNDINVINNKNTIIYGHGLQNNALFGSLKKAVDGYWHTELDNLVIKTVNDSSSYLWQIFSIYTMETNNDYIQTEFIDDNDFQDFLNLIHDRSQFDLNSNVSIDDRILTLSTCYSIDGDIKLVIHAKMIKKS